MRQVGSVVSLLLLFLIGMLVAAWQFVAPWVIGFQQGWTHATWSLIWTAALIMAVSGVALVIVFSSSVRSALQFAATRHAATAAEEGEETEVTPVAPVR
jgi:uncharacterized protein (DUF58 family)